MKKGRFSKEEIEFIEAQAEVLSPDSIAQQLDRDPVSVKKWIQENIGFSTKQKKEAEVANELKNKEYYREIKNQFRDDEIEVFQFHFKKMWSQFRDDVFHTEEMQIIDTIKLEILMNRVLKAQKDSQDQILEYQRMIQQEKQLAPDQRDNELVFDLERQVAVYKASLETLSKDYKDLQDRKARMLKDLKGTREQRIKAIEDSKQTFGSLVKQIATDSEFRKKMGIDMEKMRLAMENEKVRLSEYHTYEDNAVDQPFLTPETIAKED